eukprot:1566116-Ditylum_brightwellii.AAC.1
MGGYQSLLSIGNKLYSVDQVEAIGIHASVALGLSSSANSFSQQGLNSEGEDSSIINLLWTNKCCFNFN